VTTIRYLLTPRHPSASLIPKILRYINFKLTKKYPNWFGPSFDTLIPLILPFKTSEPVVNLMARMDAPGANEADNEVVYELIKVSTDEPFSKILKDVSNTFGIRLFCLHALIGSKRINFLKMEHAADVLC
jgi:hypothetical protein